MLVSDVWTRVRNTAGDSAVLQFTNTMLVDWINDAIRDIVVENRLTQKTATQNTVVGQQEYTLPTDIYKLYSVVVDDEKLRVETLQEWEGLNSGSGVSTVGNSRPTQAYVWASKLNLFPKPDLVYVLKINYIYLPAALLSAEDGTTDLTTLLPPTYHARIVSYCLAQVALQDEDFVKYEKLLAEFKSGVINTAHQGETEEDLYPFMSVSARDMGDSSYWDW